MPPKAAAASVETVVDPNKPGKKYTVKVGESFQSGPSLSTIRYNDKPASVLTNPDSPTLIPGAADSVSLSLSTPEGRSIPYTGTYAASQSTECLLIFDPSTQEFTLEQLDGSFNLNTNTTGVPPIPSDNDDSEYSEPDADNPYDFRHFIVKTAKPETKDSDSEASPPPTEISFETAPAPAPTPKPPTGRAKQAAAPHAFSDTPVAKPAPKQKKTPAKAAPKKATPAKAKATPAKAKAAAAAAAAAPAASLLLPPAKPPTPDPEADRPKSLKELMSSKRAAAGADESESDADDESDDGANIDFVVEGDEDDNAPKSLFGRRKPGISAGLGGGLPMSLKRSPLVGVGGFSRREEEESSEDEDMEDAPASDGAAEEEGEEEDGFDEFERDLENMLADGDEDGDEQQNAPTPGGYTAQPMSFSSYARRHDEESSSEEE